MDAKNHIVAPKHTGLEEDMKRPDHPDFMIASELKQNKFSGLRNNTLNESSEIWVDGVLKASVSKEALALNPLAINEAYSEIFGLGRILPDTKECRAFGSFLDAKDNIVIVKS